MMTRRKVLLGTLAIAGVAGLGITAFGRTVAEDHIVTLVTKRLSFLAIDAAGLQQFAHDHVSALLAKRPTWNRLKYHFLNTFTNSFSRYDRSNDTRTRSERVADGYASTYLLSSDFFLGGADVSRRIEYLRYYDPMVPCGNPFARPVIVSKQGV